MSAEKALPEGWRMVRFGDVVSNVNENTRDPRSLGLDRVVGLDHLDPESLPLRRWDLLDEMPDGTSFTRTFKAGQVLFGKRRAYQRKVAVTDFGGICSGDILVFESATTDLSQEFLPYVVQSDGFFDHALGTSAGSLSPRTKWQELAKYEFALPPIDEQERIVEVLDELDTALAYFRSARGLQVDLRRAVFADAFSLFSGQRKTGWGRCRSDVPVVRLGEICRVARGASPRPKGNPEYFAKEVTSHHWIMISDLSKSREGKYLTGTSEFLTDAGVLKSRPVEPGALLLTNCATVGIPVFSSISGCIHDGFLVFEDLEEVSPDLLYRLFEYLTPWFRSIAQTGTQANLNTSILKALEVPVLPREEQDALTFKLDAIDDVERKIASAEASLIRTRATILTSLLTGQVAP